MPVFSMDRTRWRGLGLIFVLFLAACGGGGSGGSGSTPPPVTAPADLSYSSPTVGTVGVTLATLSPSVNGTVSSYSVSPALPAGLSLDKTSGQITGTPVAESPAASYVITASNAAGSTTFMLSLAVLVAAPAALQYPSPQTYTAGTPVTLNPSVTGLVTRYAVAPALPAGLVLNAVTGQINGTPTTPTAAANYLITASNGTGSTPSRSR
jgi:hypothetical protein